MHTHTDMKSCTLYNVIFFEWCWNYISCALLNHLRARWYNRKCWDSIRALISRLLGFLSLRNTQTIEPTTLSGLQFPPLVQATRFLHLRVEWGAPYGRTARPSEQSERTGPPSSAFPCLRENQMAQASVEPGSSQSRVLRSAVAPHWLGNEQKWIQISIHSLSLSCKNRKWKIMFDNITPTWLRFCDILTSPQ